MAYFDTKSGSLEEAVRQAVSGQQIDEKEMRVFRVSSNKLQGNVHAKDEKEAEKIFRSKGAKGKITITDRGPVSKMPRRMVKNEVELDEGYEKEVLLVLKDAGISGSFRSGKLYVDKQDMEDARSALKDSDKFNSLPRIVGEEFEIEEKLDPVNKKAVKKDFDDRKDKDIDNDGDVDSTDKYLHKRRKAVSKAISKDEGNAFGKALKDAREKGDKTFVVSGKTYNVEDYDVNENYELGTPENTKAKLDATPGQSPDEWQQQVDTMKMKNMSMREALAKMWDVDEGHNPFKKEEKAPKKEAKTMTGKPMTKVTVDPDMKEKVKTETAIGKKNIK